MWIWGEGTIQPWLDDWRIPLQGAGEVEDDTTDAEDEVKCSLALRVTELILQSIPEYAKIMSTGKEVKRNPLFWNIVDTLYY